jgi:hypothetical protein
MSILIDGYEIDVAISEEHTYDSEVTEHPVESGSAVVDNVRPRPISVSIEGFVSDTPIGELAKRREGSSLPSSEAFARLQIIRDAREPITISTSLRDYDNMILESLSIPTSSENGGALHFRATFKQIRIVTNERTTIRVAEPRGKSGTNRGNKPSPKVTPTQLQAFPPGPRSLLVNRPPTFWEQLKNQSLENPGP